jgi:uncharacterized protein (DUF305 family)
MRNALLTCLAVLAASTGCSTPPRSPAPAPTTGAVVRADPDVRFMTDMIHHHAQAVLIAGWAESHGASDAIRRLCQRIVVAQRDEISLMSTWLVDKHLPVPDVSAAHAQAMPGMDHSVHMPGMLTNQQLAELDGARGPEFDRLFLTFMIQHHKGALTMVEQLFGSYGSAQDAFVFRLASDISAGQTAEIDRMNIMLNAMPQAPGQ